MKKEELIFCPLGGSGEIGGNMNLYAYGNEDNQKWIIVDMVIICLTVPGIDLQCQMRDLLSIKKMIYRIVLTHT